MPSVARCGWQETSIRVPTYTIDAYLRRFDAYLRLKNSKKAKEYARNIPTSF
jgi:hypothetical protein